MTARILKHGDKVTIQGDDLFAQKVTIGTVMGYAAAGGDCPITAYNETVDHNKMVTESEHARHRQSEIRKIVWVNLEGTMISTQHRTEQKRPELSVGDTVRIEGDTYTIKQARNHNFTLAVL